MNKKASKSFQTSDGTIIPYKITGKGDPILFVHGLFGASNDFNEAIKILSKRYCCISFDLRGHGQSTATSGFSLDHFAQDLKELIEHLTLDHITVVGYSLGAFTVFNYVQRYGCKYFKKIILVDITPKIINDISWNYGLYRGDYLNEHLENDLATINNNFMQFASYFTYRNMTKYQGKPYRMKASILSKMLAKRLIKNTAKTRRLTYDLWSDVAKLDHRPTLRKLDVPTAVFYANPGSLFTPRTAKYMQLNIPGSTKLVAFKHAGHALVFSHGKQFAHEITTFIEQ